MAEINLSHIRDLISRNNMAECRLLLGQYKAKANCEIIRGELIPKEGLRKDTQALSLLSDAESISISALHTTGDGSCLYNACSLAIIGKLPASL